MLVKAGSTLLVPRGAHATADVAGHVAEHASIALAPEPAPGRKVRFVAGKRGDSVAAVARRYGVSTTAVATANGVAPNFLFKAGQTILVNLPAAKPNRLATQKPTRKVSAKPVQRPTASPKAKASKR
jgi:membrane-bound lytic murein transglycosylase D